MKNILVAIDGSDCSTRAVLKAKDIAELSGGNITLLHVYNSLELLRYQELPRDFIEKQVKFRNEILSNGKALLSDLGNRVTTKLIEGAPADEILKFAENGNFDLVVIGGHGWSGFREFLVGGIAHKIINKVNIPILVIK